MTTLPGHEVSIRPPVLIRVYVVVFLLAWIGVSIWSSIVSRHGWSVVVGILFATVGVALGWRLLRLGVSSEEDGTLTIHNNIGSRRLSREQVEEFRVGSSGGTRIGQRGIQVLLRDGTTYGLDVCRTPFGFGFGATRLNRQVDQLNAWLRSGQ